MKPSASIVRLIAAITECCSRKLCCIRSRRRSSQRYLSLSVSSTFSSSSWNGSGVDRERMRTVSTWSSTSPVGRFGLTASGARATTSPSACRTNSLRTSCATPAASAARSGLITNCTLPVWSRRSMKTRPAVVAARVGPPCDGQPLADVLGAQFAAVKIAPAHGPVRVATTSPTATVTSWRPAARTTASRSRRITTVGAPEREACESCPFVERPA